MQTPNHSVISELLKSINAAAELCKTKLPDQTNMASIGKSLTPKSPDNLQENDDSMKQDPKSQKTKSLQKADLSENVDRIYRKRRIVALNSSDDELEQSFRTKFTTPPEFEFMGLDGKPDSPLFVHYNPTQPATQQPDVANPLAAHVTCRIDRSKKRKRCMDCNDCHKYSFVQQNGPSSYLPDGTKPTTRQCAAWQRYDRWRKRGGNSLEYSAWHSRVDLHGPRYAADKDIRDQAKQFVTLSNVEKANGEFDETF
jgi:hypothetical protein